MNNVRDFFVEGDTEWTRDEIELEIVAELSDEDLAKVGLLKGETDGWTGLVR